ncbi:MULTISPECIES: hypothetical protein [unclassified Clostridium]|uniref:hypothetical protein n=1 Tax=unclassified Clostridium TaxID=2614128 RepID=UPI0025BC2C3E|nr:MULTISPECIES: hypothetical protein [unclassified Clostridium]
MNKIARLIYDSYKGNIPTQYASVSKSDREEAIRKELFNVLGIEKFTKKDFRRAWREKKNEVYAIIEDVANQIMINGDYQKNTFFNQFVEVKNLALGDTNEFYVEGKNEIEFAEFSGSHWDLRRTRIDVGSSFQPAMRDYGVKIYEYFERVASGRTDMSKLVVLIAEAVEKKLSSIAQATFATAISSLPTEFTVGGSYSESDIIEMLTHIEASNGQKPVLVGTAAAIRKLQGVKDLPISDNMADTLNEIGYLPVWQGYKCLEIAQGHKIGTFEFTMSNTEIYALCGDDKLVKMTLEGDTEVKEISDGTTNADRSMEQTVAFKAGCGVAYSKMIGVISLA